MNEKIAIIVQNLSDKYLLVKPKEISTKNKKETAKYEFPNFLMEGEDSIEFTLSRLVETIFGDGHIDSEQILEFESDEYETTYYFVKGDFEISTRFYEKFESYLYVGLDEKSEEMTEESVLVLSSLKDIVV